MKRFVKYTQTLEGDNGELIDIGSKSPERQRKRSIQRVDTGLKRRSSHDGNDAKEKDLEDYKVTISPSRDPKQRYFERNKVFTVKPSQINNFTGKRISSPEKEKSRSPAKRGEASQFIDLDGPELKVQVGDKT